jgi:primosomal protein N' (replication factor Y) (superfamily II helicase)
MHSTPTENSETWIEVLVDCPSVEGVFTYRVPASLSVQPGAILSVPFASQQVGAIALRHIKQLPPDLSPSQIKLVESVITEAFFPSGYWELLNRVAQYYYTSLTQVLRVALPPGLLGRSQRRIRLLPTAEIDPTCASLSAAATEILQLLQSQKQGDYSWQHVQRQVRFAHRGLRELVQRSWVESYLAPPTTVRPKQRQAIVLTANANLERLELTARQREVLDVLKRHGGEAWLSDFLQTCRTTSTTLKALAQLGYLILEPREILRIEQSPLPATDQPRSLTPDQAAALSVIAQSSGNTQILLHGVTGSGKTEVYLQAIVPILHRGDSALVLVPEIGLTPQLTDRFRARFGSQVCVYHSALSDGERYDTWRQMLSGEPQVVIGTRSAIFAPLPKLGLMILDEEHDTSFKQDSPAPCYHARTVAQWRAELCGCPLILGSATPSLETWLNAQTVKEYHALSMPKRVQERPFPPVTVVDMRRELNEGNRSIFSRTLHAALDDLHTTRQQGILFIHRRGHSTFVSCRSCGYVLECPNCDVSLAYHHTHEQAQPLLRCHYCNFSQLHPPRCPSCQSPYLKYFGSGTQRVMQDLAQQFPDLRCLRFDSDTTRTKGAHRALLTRFAAGEADLLVGTQMLTKGIDLPQVTLVGIMTADGLLHLSDYRASERAAQTLIQVAGRAGRGAEPGRVILQTYTPEHPVIETVRHHDYLAFTQQELQQRQDLNYPPYGRLILLRISSPDLNAVKTTAERLAQVLQTPSTDRYQILGPAPAQVMRVARRYRWQILLKLTLGVTPSQLPDLPQLLRSHCPSSVSLTIDVDPLNLL